MKKLLALLLALIMVLSLVACADEGSWDNDDDDDEESETTSDKKGKKDPQLTETLELEVTPGGNQKPSVNQGASKEETSKEEIPVTEEFYETEELPNTPVIRPYPGGTTPSTPTAPSLTNTEKALIGNWKLYIDMGAYFENAFKGNAMASYIDYDRLSIRYMDITLRDDKTCTISINGSLSNADFTTMANVLTSNFQEFCTENNLSFEATFGMSPAQYAAQVATQYQQSAGFTNSQSGTSTGTWTYSSGEIRLISDKNQSVLRFMLNGSEGTDTLIVSNPDKAQTPLKMVKQ